MFNKGINLPKGLAVSYKPGGRLSIDVIRNPPQRPPPPPPPPLLRTREPSIHVSRQPTIQPAIQPAMKPTIQPAIQTATQQQPVILEAPPPYQHVITANTNQHVGGNPFLLPFQPRSQAQQEAQTRPEAHPQSHTQQQSSSLDENPRPPIQQHSLAEAYILCVSPLGLLGAHHFYLGRYRWGFLYMMTLGLLGCGYVIDWFRLPALVHEANNPTIYRYQRPNSANSCCLSKTCRKKTLHDAYTLWFPLGLFGFHHWYLNNKFLAFLYAGSLGFCGIGWIYDAIVMKDHVEKANLRLEQPWVEVPRNLNYAYPLAFTPFGIFGGAHYFLNRDGWGCLYTFTVGLLGVGFVADWFRIPLLVKRAKDGQIRVPGWKFVDDAYILWLPPFGILGFHHFYLGRGHWGVFYLLTAGVFGIGWLVDMLRIPELVRQANFKLGFNPNIPPNPVQVFTLT